jgi:hypothetical protein
LAAWPITLCRIVTDRGLHQRPAVHANRDFISPCGGKMFWLMTHKGCKNLPAGCSLIQVSLVNFSLLHIIFRVLHSGMSIASIAGRPVSRLRGVMLKEEQNWKQKAFR